MLHRATLLIAPESPFRWLAVSLFCLSLTGAALAGSRHNSPPATPWVGATGISESTGAIMARATDDPPELETEEEGKESHRPPRGRFNVQSLPVNPASTDPGGGSSAAPAPDALTTALNFTGATLADTGAFPPDSMGAVGPAQFIVAVNGRIRSFSKSTGTADGVLNVDTDVFFASVMTPPVTNNFTSDPRIRYDRLSGRWFIIIIDVPGRAGALPNRVLIAASNSGVITASTVWTFFQFQQDLVAPQNNSDNGKFADYPTLGIDAHALYIGVNIFGTRGLGSFANTTVFVVRKSSVLGAGPIVATAFRKLVGNGTQGGPYTPQGVDNFDPAATEGYIIAVDAAFYGRLQLRRISDPGGTPTISGNVTITVPATSGTITVPHLGNTGGANGNLDGLDYRLMAAHLRNGRLWTCANIAVNNIGSPTGTDTRMGIRWYELDGIATGQTPGVVQSGTLFQPSASNTTDQRSYWMGTIMVSGQGHALMGFSVAGANERINAGYAGRLATDAAGTLRTPVLYTASTSDYNPPSDPGGAGGRRWGDYSYTSLDPDDDMTMWTIQEWCNAANFYAVQVVKVLAPPPATPAAASPTNLTRGQTNVSVTLAGTVVEGSGFFDPGPGFSNRIAASVSGGGVTVSGVTYNNPTNLTLTLSVAANAPLGSRIVTVTNPDGQSLSSASALLNIVGPSSNQPPSLAAITNYAVDELTLLTFTVSASDPDGNQLSYSLVPGSPPGAAINPTNGFFSWTPTEPQGPSSNLISVVVTDDGSPPLSTTNSFSVTVLESNLPPQIVAPSNWLIHAGAAIEFTNSASDPDLPANLLTFSLDPGAPTGAGVDPVTGVFTWATTATDAGTTNPVTVRVTDNAAVPLSASSEFTVTVGAPLEIDSIALDGPSVTVNWRAIVGLTYRVQYRTNFETADWTDLPGDVTATDALGTKTDDKGADQEGFYRVKVWP